MENAWMPPALHGVVKQTEGGKKGGHAKQGLGAEDQQLILVARTICWLEYGR